MFAMSRDAVTAGYRDTDYALYQIPASGAGTSTGGFYESRTGSRLYAMTGPDGGGSVRVTGRSGGDSDVSYGDNTYSGHVKVYFRFTGGAEVSPGELWENTAVYSFCGDMP